MNRFYSLVAAFGLAIASAPAAAASVLPLYLEEVIDTATTAFEGTCTENRTEVDPATQFVVTYTTFAVLDTLKGTPGATHVIKQIGGSLPGEGPQHRVHGIPTFTVGDTYVVFLAGVSSIGFSSPIGLGQGRFAVTEGTTGRKVANGRDFRDMTARMGAALPARTRARLERDENPVTDMDLEEFKQVARARVQGGR